MNDDSNSPVLIAHLFDGVRIINSVNDKRTINAEDLENLKRVMHTFVFDVLVSWTKQKQWVAAT